MFTYSGSGGGTEVFSLPSAAYYSPRVSATIILTHKWTSTPSIHLFQDLPRGLFVCVFRSVTVLGVSLLFFLVIRPGCVESVRPFTKPFTGPVADISRSRLSNNPFVYFKSSLKFSLTAVIYVVGPPLKYVHERDTLFCVYGRRENAFELGLRV